MAHFYGYLQGNARTAATRAGTESSGLEAQAIGHTIGGRVFMGHIDSEDFVALGVNKGEGPWSSLVPLLTCVLEEERIICTLNKHLPEHIIIK